MLWRADERHRHPLRAAEGSGLLAEQDCCSLPTAMDRNPYAPPAAIGALLNTAAMVAHVIGIALIHATVSQLPVLTIMTPLVNGQLN